MDKQVRVICFITPSLLNRFLSIGICLWNSFTENNLVTVSVGERDYYSVSVALVCYSLTYSILIAIKYM